MRRAVLISTIATLVATFACGGDDEGGRGDALRPADASVSLDGPVADGPVADGPVADGPVADATPPDASIPDAAPPDAVPPDALPGTQVTLTATMDATICLNGTTDGAIGDGNLFVGRSLEHTVRRALVRFDVSSIPSGSTVLDAALRLQVDKKQGSVAAQAFLVSTDWAQGPATGGGSGSGGGECSTPGGSDASWNQTGLGGNWITAGGDFASTASGQSMLTPIGTYDITGASIVTDVQGWIDGTNPSYGWILVSTDELTDGNASRIVTAPTLLVRYQAP